jgi:hypothetical protein
MYETGSPHVARNKRFELTPFRHTWVVEYAMPLCGGQFDLKTTVYKIEFGGEGSPLTTEAGREGLLASIRPMDGLSKAGSGQTGSGRRA